MALFIIYKKSKTKSLVAKYIKKLIYETDKKRETLSNEVLQTFKYKIYSLFSYNKWSCTVKVNYIKQILT